MVFIPVHDTWKVNKYDYDDSGTYVNPPTVKARKTSLNLETERNTISK